MVSHFSLVFVSFLFRFCFVFVSFLFRFCPETLYNGNIIKKEVLVWFGCTIIFCYLVLTSYLVSWRMLFILLSQLIVLVRSIYNYKEFTKLSLVGGGAGGLANRCGILGNGETSVIGVICIVILSSAVAVIREKSDPALPVWQFSVRSTLQTIL